MLRVGRVFRAHLGALHERVRGQAEYATDTYWEGRSRDLIEGYDHPETWDKRGWMRGGIEEQVVPELLHGEGVRSVLVPGAGSGRQYEFLLAAGFEPRGFDISPTLVQTCEER